MSTVFKHRDVDGDTFRVSKWHNPGVLSFEVIPEVDSTFVNMNRDAVLSLIQVLTEWAYPTHTPEGPNRSLIEELIAKAVKDQVSAVLPLHLSPVAEHRPQECPGAGRCPEAEPCNEPLRPGQILMETHKECGLLWVTHRPEEDPEADPEPGDIGHPRPPLPLRKKTVIVPECGLCKRPWNDGHGQPGDPCPGVEEARQHPGDWTDALWRVQPSAPASEARYCDGCGHSWEVHAERGVADTWCTATKGKGRCGCTRRPE